MYMHVNIGNRIPTGFCMYVRTYAYMYVKIVPLREEKFWGSRFFRLTNINNWFSVF